jgi:ankyrin repeat protein
MNFVFAFLLWLSAIGLFHCQDVEIDLIFSDKNAGLSSPLFLASATGNLHDVKLHLSSGIDVNLRSSTGWTAAMFAVKYRHKEVLEQVKNSFVSRTSSVYFNSNFLANS